MYVPEALCVYIQNVPVCTSTTPTFSIHVDVVLVHTGGVLNLHTGVLQRATPHTSTHTPDTTHTTQRHVKREPHEKRERHVKRDEDEERQRDMSRKMKMKRDRDGDEKRQRRK